jgi:hypothetical protein
MYGLEMCFEFPSMLSLLKVCPHRMNYVEEIVTVHVHARTHIFSCDFENNKGVIGIRFWTKPDESRPHPQPISDPFYYYPVIYMYVFWVVHVLNLRAQ